MSLGDDFSSSSISPEDHDVYNKIPEKYCEYFDVFSPTEVQQLPLHHLYDCSIELEGGKTPQFGPIYSLS